VRLTPEADESVARSEEAVRPGRDPEVPAGETLFCPQCGAEYRPGFTACADCEVPLTPAAPDEPLHPEPRLEVLTEIVEPALLPVIVSLLQSAGIQPVVNGEEIMGLWPLGQAGSGWTGWGRGLSVVVQVNADRAEEAKALLAAAQEDGLMEDEQGDEAG
jgi:hypothetical protein